MTPDETFFNHLDRAAGSDPVRYMLANKGAYDRAGEIAVQLECRGKMGKKLPRELSGPRFYFPSVLAAEQATSDILADFHASLISPGSSVLDMTAGLGIDAMRFATRASRVTAVECQAALAEALLFNAAEAGIENITVVEADSTVWLESSDGRWDYIYIDPHRRGEGGERVFNLTHCAPDVTALLPLLKERCRTLIIKASPMLDISRTLLDLPGTGAIYVTGTATECKEIVAVDDFDNPVEEPDKAGITIYTPEYGMTFTRAEEAAAPVEYGVPSAGGYLFEPGPTTMKAAPWRLLSSRFGIKKLAPNTHLYTSDKPVAGFPGTVRRIIEVLPYASSVIKRLASRYPKAEVAVRNFDTSADKLRTKLGVKNGSAVRIIATTLTDSTKIMLVLENE